MLEAGEGRRGFWTLETEQGRWRPSFSSLEVREDRWGLGRWRSEKIAGVLVVGDQGRSPGFMALETRENSPSLRRRRLTREIIGALNVGG